MKPIKSKNEKKTAAASLKYDPGRDYAPQVTAAGKGYVAEKIIETAKDAGVPVYRDEALAETLSRLRVGDMIPRELFEVVAEVLAYVIGIDNQRHRASGYGSVGDIEGRRGGGGDKNG